VGQPILIVGASGRAASASALRAGFDPFVIDLFADADTRRLSPVLKCDPADYPNGFIELAKQAPPGPWMYTGGLENYPEVVAAISEQRTLWGNGPDLLGRLRDPFKLSEFLSGKALQHPQVLPANTTLPASERWLRKPRRGSGGGGIWFVNPHNPGGESVGHYYQQFVAGRSFSAIFATFAPGFRILGYTEQLTGTPWLHAEPFRYSGSIGPVPFTGSDLQDLHLTAFRIGDQTGHRGLANIDFIHDGERSHIIEINPRYPASAEVIEYASAVPLLDWHLKGVNRLHQPKHPQPWQQIHGKAIYYAAKTIRFPHFGPWDISLAHCTDVWNRPDYADIPEPDTVIESGQPVLTLLAQSQNEQDCLALLKCRAAELDQLFGVPEPPEE
jgi:uncharacterized protein